MTAAKRRAPIYGPEEWLEHAGAPWVHWDRWYCLVCVEDFAGDWDALAERLSGRSGRLHSGPDAEAKLSHLDYLVARLDGAGLGAGALAGLEPADSRLLAKARRKVLQQGLAGHDYTHAMVNTPRRRRRRRALNGGWDVFPVDPAGPYEQLVETFDGCRHIPKGATFDIVRDFEQTLADIDQQADDPAVLLAVRRAALAAVAELAHRGDDSYGNISDAGRQIWKAYIATDWRGLVEPVSYWRDIAELVAFDDYSHLHQRETLPWSRACRSEVAAITDILLALADEYRTVRLDWHADQATIAVAWLHVATRHLDGFAEVAQRLGSSHWMPIVGLAERALGCRRPDVAQAVFDAADQPGWHRDYLHQQRTRLLGNTSARTHLHLVTDD